MTRIILYVRNVAVLKNFYQKHFEFSVVEEIAGEWVVLNGGAVELALHLMGKQYRCCMPTDGTTSNAKLVFTVRSGLLQLRDELLAAEAETVCRLSSVSVRRSGPRGKRFSTVAAGLAVNRETHNQKPASLTILALSKGGGHDDRT